MNCFSNFKKSSCDSVHSLSEILHVKCVRTSRLTLIFGGENHVWFHLLNSHLKKPR